MDFVNLNEMMATKKRNIHLFGTDNFRSWMLYFVPGDGTDMHYHANPETFWSFQEAVWSKASRARRGQFKRTR